MLLPAIGAFFVAGIYALGVYILGKRSPGVTLLVSAFCSFAVYVVWVLTCLELLGWDITRYLDLTVIGVIISFVFFVFLPKAISRLPVPVRSTKVYPQKFPKVKVVGDGWVRR